MSTRIDQLFDEARTLAPEDRSLLALALLDSVEGEASDEAMLERAWIAEAHKRLALIASGEMKTTPWTEAKARILDL
jgi:putative addiction module component (TIGR02574 family)